MKRIAIVVVLFALVSMASAIDRFPRPQFDTAYEMPTTTTPAARAGGFQWMDVALLAAALAASSAIALKVRRRRTMWGFAILCLLYFGFWRNGCVCPVGSLQNVAAAAGDPTFQVSIPILLFFVLPLLVALIAGRTFCGSVCALGAIQDVFVFRPIKLPLWAVAALEMLACAYLGVAVLMASVGGGFLVCQYDPFVGLFRFSGPWPMIAAGIGLLALGLFVARPYCRFLCPYGVLLRLASLLSWKHLAITPGECIDCRLCADSCPFGAILAPTPDRSHESTGASVKRMGLSLLMIPLLIAGGVYVGRAVAPHVAAIHPRVALAEQLRAENADPSMESTLESDAFRLTGTPLSDLYGAERIAKKRIHAGMGWVGAFVGGVFAMQMFELAIRRKRSDYIPDRGRCLSCARCVEFCPKEHEARKQVRRE